MVYNWLTKKHKYCLLCGLKAEQHPLICDGCYRDLPWLGHCCRRCALPITAPASYCGRCLRKPPQLDFCQSLFYYSYPARELVSELKFNSNLKIARLLGRLLAQHLLATGLTQLPQAILPVPLHQQRLKSRGYNQSVEIARYCADELALPIIWSGCERYRFTAQQTSLQLEQRHKNLKGAFRVTAALPSSIMVIDDVMTTGATLNELAATLHRAGVKHIQGWTICRTVLD